jgi:nitroreductase
MLFAMEVLDAIRHVRVVRAYAARPIEPEAIATILDAGRHSGSSKNLQRWDFILVTERDTLERLGTVGRYAGHTPGAAAVIALVTPDPGASPFTRSIVWDIGRVAQNMVLAAWALGVGSCPVSVYEQELARDLLGYPADRACSWFLTLGYPADPADLTRPPRAGGRKRLAEILHRERW